MDVTTTTQLISYLFKGTRWTIRCYLRLGPKGNLHLMMEDTNGTFIGEWDQSCGGALGPEFGVDIEADHESYLELEDTLFDQFSTLYPFYFTSHTAEYFKSRRLSKNEYVPGSVFNHY